MIHQDEGNNAQDKTESVRVIFCKAKVRLDGLLTLRNSLESLTKQEGAGRSMRNVIIPAYEQNWKFRR